MASKKKGGERIADAVLFRHAKSLLDRQFACPDLSLACVAAQLGVSP